MLLILSIVLSTFLGFLLLSTMGPIYGGIMAFGIVAGCLFRGVYLLNEINQHILKNPVKKHQIQDYVKKQNRVRSYASILIKNSYNRWGIIIRFRRSY